MLASERCLCIPFEEPRLDQSTHGVPEKRNTRTLGCARTRSMRCLGPASGSFHNLQAASSKYTAPECMCCSPPSNVFVGRWVLPHSVKLYIKADSEIGTNFYGWSDPDFRILSICYWFSLKNWVWVHPHSEILWPASLPLFVECYCFLIIIMVDVPEGAV